MRMRHFMFAGSKLFKLALGLAALAGVAAAGTITQTFVLPSTTLDITGSTGIGTFEYFKSIAYPTLTLTGVTIEISVNETLNSLSVTNTASNSNTFQYLTFSNIFVVGTAPTTDQTSLKHDLNNNGGANGDIDLYDTGSVTYSANQTINWVSSPLPAVNDDTGVQNAASISPYNTTGTFTLGFTTSTNQSFVGGGGNDRNNQATIGGGTVTVIYNYTGSTPEPATFMLFGSALVGIAAGLKRRQRKA